jgi:threonine/homoserine/homoserine lactone efflux protein
MPNWPALLVAPTLALTNLSITYALVTPSCARQDRLALNAVSALVLLLCVWFSWQAWRNWRMAPARSEPGDARAQRKPFVALVACMTGALSCLVVLAQWFPQWILSPCAS